MLQKKDLTPLAGYSEPYGLLLATLQDATYDWRAELWVRDLDPEIVTWRVRPGGASIGAIVLHMIIAELYWAEIVALGREVGAEDKLVLMWDDIDIDAGKWPDPPAEPLSWYLALHDRYRARILESIKDWPAPDSRRIGGGNLDCSMSWIIGRMIQHQSYHGGQISMIHDQWKAAMSSQAS